MVQDGLKEMENSIERLREFVKLLRCSPANYQSFKEFVVRRYEELKAVEKPTLDVKTRWNSTYHMLQTILPFRFPITAWIIENRLLGLEIQNVDWEYADKLVQVLKPFYTATVKLSAQDKPTIHTAYFIVNVLKEHLARYLMDETPVIRTAAVNMMTKFNKYFETMPKFIVIAHVLDPQYKMAYITVSNNITTIATYRAYFIDFFNDYYANVTPTTTASAASAAVTTTSTAASIVTPTDPFLSAANLFSQTRTNPSAVHNRLPEVDRYLNDHTVSLKEDFDILAFWRMNEDNYPALSRMAKDILAIPATSVSSESAFSNSSRVVNDYRSKLNPRTVQTLLLGENWVKKQVRRETQVIEIVD